MRSISQPLISIIVPIFNTDRFLDKCLSSIAKQSLNNIEVLCIDDGSTDGSPSIVDAFASADPRIAAIHKPNEGYGKGINTGLDNAKGKYIGIVESDDYVDPSMFEKLFSAAQRHKFPDIVKCAYWRVLNAETRGERLLPAYYLHHVDHVDVPFTLNEDAEFLFHHPSIWTAIYKKSFLEKNRIKMKEVPGAGWVDNPFLIETLAQAESIVYIDEPLYFYREMNEGSSSRVKDPSIIYDRWFDMDALIKKLGITSPRIMEGHYNRGCSYIKMLDEEFGVDSPTIEKNIQEMIHRMDYPAIVSSRKILREYKKALRKHIPITQRIGYRFGSKRKNR
ncbi:MAG: glycosyltransferase [Eggerthellaceae bacterium]|nr:glycosyltransferase [Eggerthellaceae bacterium]